MLKIYIAGKITGEPIAECKQKFLNAENLLRELSAAPVNPFKLGLNDTWTFEQCKPFNFKAIAQCNALFMLADYTASPGALAELDEAKRLRLTVYYEQQGDYDRILEDVNIEIPR